MKEISKEDVDTKLQPNVSTSPDVLPAEPSLANFHLSRRRVMQLFLGTAGAAMIDQIPGLSGKAQASATTLESNPQSTEEKKELVNSDIFDTGFSSEIFKEIQVGNQVALIAISPDGEIAVTGIDNPTDFLSLFDPLEIIKSSRFLRDKNGTRYIASQRYRYFGIPAGTSEPSNSYQGKVYYRKDGAPVISSRMESGEESLPAYTNVYAIDGTSLDDNYPDILFPHELDPEVVELRQEIQKLRREMESTYGISIHDQVTNHVVGRTFTEEGDAEEQYFTPVDSPYFHVDPDLGYPEEITLDHLRLIAAEFEKYAFQGDTQNASQFFKAINFQHLRLIYPGETDQEGHYYRWGGDANSSTQILHILISQEEEYTKFVAHHEIAHFVDDKTVLAEFLKYISHNTGNNYDTDNFTFDEESRDDGFLRDYQHASEFEDVADTVGYLLSSKDTFREILANSLLSEAIRIKAQVVIYALYTLSDGHFGADFFANLSELPKEDLELVYDFSALQDLKEMKTWWVKKALYYNSVETLDTFKQKYPMYESGVIITEEEIGEANG